MITGTGENMELPAQVKAQNSTQRPGKKEWRKIRETYQKCKWAFTSTDLVYKGTDLLLVDINHPTVTLWVQS